MYRQLCLLSRAQTQACGWGNMRQLSSLALCLLCWIYSGSASDIADLTLINPDPVVTSVNSSLLCVSSDWTSTNSLTVNRDAHPAHPHPPTLTNMPDERYRSATKIDWTNRNGIFGSYFCRFKGAAESGKIYTYKMLNEAAFLPESLTITASIGENVNISYVRKKVLQMDPLIYKNGTFLHSLPKHEIFDTLQYPIKSAAFADAGLYTARYIADSDITAGITRLIVRKCRAQLWGPDCSKSCPECANGGVCHDETGECVCPPGFKGSTCEIVCGEGRFGRTCKERCMNGNCQSMVFCLRDPYGCSCSTGWRGLNCREPCPAGYYGAGCKLRCMCGGKGKCDRYRGCVCPGRHGSRCEGEDKPPVVVSTFRDTEELNAGVVYAVNCSARGQPVPLHGDIILLKPDRTPVYALDTETVNDQTTSMFRVDKISVSDTGHWRCQVNTTAGQVGKDFLVIVKVPPQPQYPPFLNGSGPYHLVIHVNKEPYSGDGPVTSVKVAYKQVNTSSWRMVEVMGSQVKLENLTPMTEYTTFVLLARRGVGGTGYPGPEASFYTQLLECSYPTGIKLVPLSQTALDLSWDPLDRPTKDDWIYQLECLQSSDPSNLQTYHLPANSTGLPLRGLKPKHKYECRLWLTSSSDSTDVQCRPGHSVGLYRAAVSAWTLSNELPPAPFNILACNVTDTSATITWSLAEGNSISKVTILYQRDQDDLRQLVEIAVPQDQLAMQFQLRGLLQDTLYQVELWAANNMGESQDRPQIHVRTLTHQESARLSRLTSEGNMLFFAILGSAGMTCITILIAFCIVLQLKRATFQRRMVQAFQNIVREEPVVQFSSGTLNMPKKSMHTPQHVAYPALEWNDIKFQDVIGEGNFGQVLKASIKKDGLRMDAAIKRMKEYASKDDHRDFAGELEVLCKLGHHPNIINLLGACEHRGYLYLAIEFAPHGNLLDFLRKSRVLETDPAFAIAHSTASTLSSQQLLHFAADVARGMDYLSQKQFIHRDLAARNILVGENFVAKIADFGLSRGQEVYVKKTMGRLPVRWMAIESLNYSVYTTNSDVWSYGVLLWEIVSLGGTPYCGMTCAELYEKLPQGYRLEKPLNCDDEVYDLMRQCWREKPYERPSFTQILVSLNRMLEERKTYVNTTLYEKFTYAGIDCSAEEAG
ncbi:tyrosine-protein kinase receptor Tie-2 [Alosa sapidissima]|uniref:tyrosine-protein kinase receptor Tie-2 n=1 Tax=Alosa sapidissima TaxID=34773 RepID=UPI001C0A50FE|nr:tyrosine-protein kinase receptor Tie-2 [Alosa sapidissima]